MSAPRSAAEWFAKRRGPRDPTLEQEFDRWLASDASHGGAYALCEAAWALSAGPAQVAAERRSTRVRTLRACAGFLALAAGVAAVAFWFWPAPAQAWSTLAGEQRTLTLADGSTVVLNTRTRIHVRLSHRTREVELDEGEAFFEVAHDALRPFTVQTRLGSARAVGTHFNVDLRPSRLVVTTTEGRVLVRSVSTGAGVYVSQWGGLGSGNGQLANPSSISMDALGNFYDGFHIFWKIRGQSPLEAPQEMTLSAWRAFCCACSVGMVSGPIKTEHGYYLVMLSPLDEAIIQTDLATKERLRQELLADKRRKRFDEVIADIRANGAVRFAEASRYINEDTGKR